MTPSSVTSWFETSANIQSLWAFVVCLSCGDHEQNIPLSAWEEQIAMCVRDRTRAFLVVNIRVPFQKRADFVILGNTVESEETGHFLGPGLAFAFASQSS